MQENLAYFKAEGVNLDSLEALTSTRVAGAQRSETAIISKNIPATSSLKELGDLFGAFGPLSRLLLPPSRTVCLVEYVNSSDAKRAFKSLAYTKYQHVPLYLEWAPEHALPQLKAQPIVAAAPRKEEESTESTSNDNSNACVVFVGNLSAEANEAKLRELCEPAGPIRSVTLSRLPKAKGSPQKARYAFVEFLNERSVDACIEKLRGAVLDGRSLDVKRQKAKPPAAPASAQGAKSAPAATSLQTRIVVRNLAFQATAAELRELFSAFGALKSLRLPKKSDGNHRGFAFIEFCNAFEAAEAMKRMTSTHFYGRRLILDWVNENGKSLEDQQAEAGKSLERAVASSQKRKAASMKGSDLLEASGEMDPDSHRMSGANRGQY